MLILHIEFYGMSVVVKGARSQSHSPTFSNSPSEPLAPHIETIKLILSSLGRSVQRTSQGPMKLGHYRFMASRHDIALAQRTSYSVVRFSWSSDSGNLSVASGFN